MRNFVVAVFAVLLALSPLPSRAAVSAEALQQEIADARRELPKAFNAVARIRQDMPKLDREKHGRLAPIGPLLKGVGRTGLLPILEQLLAGAKAPELAQSARTAWAVGLLEAVGSLRDARAEVPVLQMLSAESDPDVVRAAAVALSKVSKTAADVLVPMAQKSGPKQAAVVGGLGECREARAAQALSDILAGHPDEKMARAAAKSLGEIGSAWVWQSPDFHNNPEREAVRSIAARALVAGWVAYTDVETSRAMETALVILDAPEAKALAQKARAEAQVTPARKAEFDNLVRLLENNPLRQPAGMK
jgi:hypothetical protein